MHVIVAGCGWLGTALARRLVSDGARVTGIRRHPARAAALREAGVEPLALDLATRGAAAKLPKADAIVACQSAAVDSEDAYRAAYVRSNEALLEAAARDGARFVYTGSTGVFGQRDGSEVDEASRTVPASPTAEVLVAAEALVRAGSRSGVNASVIRLSGLYGPGRTGIVERVRSGRLALGPGEEAWMNFCHLEDAIRFVLAALAKAAPGGVYHGTDASPGSRREVVEWIAERLGIPPPRTVVGAPGPNRRISSARTREALGVTLAYPSFREGLAPVIPPPDRALPSG